MTLDDHTVIPVHGPVSDPCKHHGKAKGVKSVCGQSQDFKVKGGRVRQMGGDALASCRSAHKIACITVTMHPWRLARIPLHPSSSCLMSSAP